jgi:hypothetical protein
MIYGFTLAHAMFFQQQKKWHLRKFNRINTLHMRTEGYMKLKEYLKLNHIRKGDFAEKIPVHPATLYRWISNKCLPTRLAIDRINKLTKGIVTEKDFYETN